MKATRVNSGDKNVRIGIKKIKANVSDKTAARQIR